MYDRLAIDLIVAQQGLDDGSISKAEFREKEKSIRRREAQIDVQMESEQSMEREAEARMEQRFDVNYEDPYDDSPYW